MERFQVDLERNQVYLERNRGIMKKNQGASERIRGPPKKNIYSRIFPRRQDPGEPLVHRALRVGSLSDSG